MREEWSLDHVGGARLGRRDSPELKKGRKGWLEMAAVVARLD